VAAIRNRFAGKFLLGHAAALYDEGKGQSVLIEAMRLLADELPNLQLLFMGSGQDELMLKNAASDLNNVSFEGFTDRLGDYFAALDMYVHPSRREGLGSVLLDAMQAELPIIASCVGGIPEIIDDHVNGLLVPAGNARVLADMILRLYADTDLSRALAQRGKACAEQYTSEIMAHKYAQLYQALSA
jgi:glycosyltransferase involved in cell wall biosynthesis